MELVYNENRAWNFNSYSWAGADTVGSWSVAETVSVGSPGTRSRSNIKEREKQAFTKPNCNLFNIWEHSSVSWCNCNCLHPMRWQISCYLDHRGCSVALHNRRLIYFALSFLYLLVTFPGVRPGPGCQHRDIRPGTWARINNWMAWLIFNHYWK